MVWEFSTDPAWQAELDWARAFMQAEVLPLEALEPEYDEALDAIRPLRDQVKQRGLWAVYLGEELGGHGVSHLRLALLNEIVGASELGPLVFGNGAPDAGNVELLALAGTADQKERWMKPVLNGEWQSSFSMTEAGTGSDPRQFTTSAVRDGDHWVVNGTKWFVANAARSVFHIVMCVTCPDAVPRERLSLLIVPSATSGINVRPIGTLEDPTHTAVANQYGEVTYDDVRVPAENLMGEEGQGLIMAQKRQGPGRVHHAMRWVGMAQRALDAMCERAVAARTGDGTLIDKQFIQDYVAKSVAELTAMRLLVLQTAWKLDTEGPESARLEIAMISYHGARVLSEILDRAIQVHGSLGVSMDMPLARHYAHARTARIYDGTDEIHKMTAARLAARRHQRVDVPTDHVPTRRANALDRNRVDIVGKRGEQP